MADPIRRQIELEVQSTGTRISAAEFAKIEQKINAAVAANKNLKNDYEALQKLVSRYSNEAVKKTKAITASTKLQRQSIAGLSRAYGGLDRAVKGAMKGVVGFASFTGLIAAVKQSMNGLKQYNNVLLESAGIGAKYGIGMKQLEGKLIGIANAMSLTRSETMQLFKAYEQTFTSFSMSGFEETLKNIQKVTGPNVKAIQEHIASLGGLIDKYPDLQAAISRASVGDRKMLDITTSRLMMTGALSVAEYKRLQTYISGSKQMSAEDEKVAKEKQEQQKTFQTFAQHAERIGLMLAEAFMPVFKEMSDWLNDNKDNIKDFFKKMVLGIKSAVTWVKGLIASFGGLKKILIGVLALWTAGKIANIGLGVAGMASSIGRSAPGLFGGIGGKAGLAKAGGLATIGAVGYGLGKAGQMYANSKSEQYKSEGNIRGAGMAQGLGGLSSVGGSALAGAGTGAAIGSLIPVIGTVVGGVVGGLVGSAVGIFNEWDTLKTGFSNWWTGSSAQAEQMKKKADKMREDAGKQTKDFLKSMKEGRNGLTEDQYSKYREIITKKAVDKFNATPLTLQTQADLQSRYDQSAKSLGQAEAKMNKKRGKTAYTYKGTAITGSEKDVTKIENAQSLVKDQLTNAYSSLTGASNEEQLVIGEKIDLLENQRRGLNHIQDIQKEIIESASKETEEYKKQSSEHATLLALKQEMTIRINKERKIIESLNGLYQARGGVLDGLIEKSKILGVVDVTATRAAADAQVAVGKVQVQQIDRYMALVNKKQSGEKETNKDLTEGSKLLEQINIKGLADLTNAEKLTALSAKRLSISNKNLTIHNKISEQFAGQISLAKTQTSIATSMVSLADNYAIGVGASAEMRMKAVDSINNEINILKERQRVEKKTLQDQIDSGQATAASREKVKKTELEIISKHQQQAQLLRSLRDGWVSAISAMNTGTGRFTKIMISQQQNMAAGLNVMGMVASAASGSTKAKDGGFGGRVGFGQGASFTGQGGNISAQYGPRGGRAQDGAMAYRTRPGDDAGRAAVWQARSSTRQATNTMTQDIAKQTARAAQSGGQLQAVTQQAQQGGFSGLIDRVGGWLGIGSGGSRGTTPGLSKGMGSGSTKGSVAYTVPGINVTVNFSEFDKFKDIVTNAIQQHVAEVSGSRSSLPKSGS